MMFIATVSRKDGRDKFVTAEYPTRDEAAQAAFAAEPNAKRCSTCKAHQAPCAYANVKQGQWVRTHLDIRSHNRERSA